MDPLSLAQVVFGLLVVFAAFVVRGMSGFGAGLIAVPLLALMFPLRAAVPVVALLSLVAALFQGVRDRRSVAWRDVGALLMPTLLGMTAGLYVFKEFDQRVLLKVLGGFVIAYAAYSLIIEHMRLAPRKCSAAWAVPAGVMTGLVDTVFGGGGGPFVVIYLYARDLGKDAFRATMAIYVLLDVAFRSLGYLASGFYDRQVMALFLAALPLAAAGMYLGDRIHVRISQHAFMRIISGILIVSGAALLIK